MPQLQNPHLARLHAEISDTIAAVRQFEALSPTQLNWKPSPKQWSIAECMQHLLIVYSKYRPQLQRKFVGQALPAAQADKPYRSTWIGRQFMHIVNPNTARKTPTVPFLAPAKGSNYPPTLIQDFVAYLTEVQQYIEKSDSLNLNKININSSVGPILWFNLGDYFEVESLHSRRHLGQMQRVAAMPAFPKA